MPEVTKLDAPWNILNQISLSGRRLNYLTNSEMVIWDLKNVFGILGYKEVSVRQCA